jgi:hypothetical protein
MERAEQTDLEASEARCQLLEQALRGCMAWMKETVETGEITEFCVDNVGEYCEAERVLGAKEERG